MHVRYVQYDDIKVYYKENLDGGGNSFGVDYVPFIKERLGKVGRVYEWCSGPAFIGFSLLAAGVCESLCVADVNLEAVEMLRKTVSENSLHDRVSVYHSNGLDDIPNFEQWDLVVGNPPHSGNNLDLPQWGASIIYKDPEWRLHSSFYDSVGKHLNQNGRIILQENYFCSTADTFAEMIERNGFLIRAVSPLRWPYQWIYYLWCERAELGCGQSDIEQDLSSRRLIFSYDAPAQRQVERHFREHAGFVARPILLSPDQILEHRRDLLQADAQTKAQLQGSIVKLVLTGASGGIWLIGYIDGKAILRTISSESPTTIATITMTAAQFMDLYDRRIKLLFAYFNGLLQISGDIRIAQVVLRALLAPSAGRLSD